MKTCTGCRTSKTLDMFARRAASIDGLQPKCKECTKVEMKQHYERKREQRLANKKEYYEKNKERIIAYNAERYRKNKEQALAWMVDYYRRNREERLAYQKAAAPEQRKRFKTRLKAYAASYRALKLKATPAWADKEKIAEFYEAADFLGMVTGEWYHVDHVVPLKSKLVCGLHWEGNLQVLLGSENQAKGNRHWPNMP